MKNEISFRSPHDDARVRAEATKLAALEAQAGDLVTLPPPSGSLMTKANREAVAGHLYRRAIAHQRRVYEQALRAAGREIAAEHLVEYRRLARAVAIALCRLARAQEEERRFRMAALRADIDVAPWRPFTGHPIHLEPTAEDGTLWRVLRAAVAAGHVTVEDLQQELPGVDVRGMIKGGRR